MPSYTPICLQNIARLQDLSQLRMVQQTGTGERVTTHESDPHLPLGFQVIRRKRSHLQLPYIKTRMRSRGYRRCMTEITLQRVSSAQGTRAKRCADSALKRILCLKQFTRTTLVLLEDDRTVGLTHTILDLQLQYDQTMTLSKYTRMKLNHAYNLIMFLNSLCAAFMKKFLTLHQEQPNFQAPSATRTAIVRSPQRSTVSPKPPPLHNVIDLSSDIAPASYNIFSNAKARFLTLQTVREHSIVVPPDGNCFYSALAVTLCKHYSDSSWNARRVRDTMVTYLTSEAGEIAFKHRWKPAWYEGNTGRSSTYDDFVSSVRTSTIWAVYTVLLVARRVFDRVNIRVFRPALTAGSCSSTSPSSPGTSATRLYLTLDPLKQGVNDANLVFEGDNHYNALMHMRTKELDGTQAAAIQ